MILNFTVFDYFSSLLLSQTAIYCDFFYYYLKSWKNNERLSLPS